MPYRNGFTLIEIMIVIAIISLLILIAYPNTMAHTHKAKRAALKTKLVLCAAELERRYTLTNSYDDNSCNGIVNGDYLSSIVVDCADNNTDNCFTITATALSDSMKQDLQCQVFSYNEVGVKLAFDANSNLTTDLCW